jgi:hypothetical protein
LTVSDGEIVIVDPRSRRIVEVIHRDGGRAGNIDIYAAFEQRQDVRRWRPPPTIVFQEGVILPPSCLSYEGCSSRPVLGGWGCEAPVLAPEVPG